MLCVPSDIPIIISVIFSTFNSSISLSFPDLWLDSFFSLDFGPRLTGDTSLSFQSSSVPLSGFDFSHGTLLVLSSVKDGPCDLSWIFLGFKKLFGFSVDQDDLFTISSDVSFSVAWVDGEPRKLANFGSHFMKKNV